MKKLILFALFAILIMPNAWAATGDCPNGYEWCSVYASGSNGCCIPRTSICDENSCGGTVTVPCNGLACAGQSSWTDYGDVPGKQIRCNASENVCEYRCNPDGYYRTSAGGGSAMRCAACPANATCFDGTSVCCNQNHYPVMTQVMNPGLVGMVTTYECPSCPYYQTAPEPPAMGFAMPGQTRPNTCAMSITSCFVPEGTYMKDATGRYQITGGNCFYSE